MKLDMNTKFGARTAKRLREEQVIWLTTVRPDGSPQPNPVWFLWDGETIVIYSQPTARKVSHIRNNPKVALNFNTDAGGDDVVIITGAASIDADVLSAMDNAPYLEKYRDGIAQIGMTAERMAREYSTLIRITPKHTRGF